MPIMFAYTCAYTYVYIYICMSAISVVNDIWFATIHVLDGSGSVSLVRI